MENNKISKSERYKKYYYKNREKILAQKKKYRDQERANRKRVTIIAKEQILKFDLGLDKL